MRGVRRMFRATHTGAIGFDVGTEGSICVLAAPAPPTKRDVIRANDNALALAA